MASGKVKMKIKFKVEVWASQVVLVVKTPPANAGDVRFECSIPELGRSPGGEYSIPLQYSCLENPMDKGAWCTTVHRVAKSQTRMKQPIMLAKLYLSTNWSSEESTYPTKRTSSCLHKAKSVDKACC